MIKPTIGRQVWFWPAKVSGGVLISHGDQPMAATLTYVFGDRMVNLQIIDHGSYAHALTSVPLLQEGDPRPDGYFCEWMPYQKGQAAKTEQLEKAVERNEDPRPDPGAPAPSKKLLEELRAVINRNSIENASHTPDFLLASYLGRCLDAYAEAVSARDTWFSFKPWGPRQVDPPPHQDER